MPKNPSDPEASYHIIYTNGFNERLSALNDKDYFRVEHIIDLLAYNPFLGRLYTPLYEAPKAPITCMMKFVDQTHCVLYYSIDEAARTLIFFHITDTRQNPLTYFDDLDGGEMEY